VLLEVDYLDDNIKLKTLSSESEDLDFNILVIATGGSYVSPWRAEGED
jgi:hypothetical protein